MCGFEMVNTGWQAHSVTHWCANRMNYCHVCVWDGEHWLTGSLSHSLIHKQNELLSCVFEMVNTDWQAHSVTHWFINRMNYCHVCVWDGEHWLTGSLSHSLIHKQNELLTCVFRWWTLTDRLTQSLIDSQTEWITDMCVFEMANTDWQAHSVTHWFTNRMNYCHVCV